MQGAAVEAAWTDLWAWVLSLPSWQGFLLVVGCSVVVAWMIQVGGDVLIRRVTRRVPGDVDKAVFGSIHPPLYVTVVLVGAYLGIELLVVEPGAEPNAPLEASLLTTLTVVWAYSLARMGRRVSDELTGDTRFDSRVVPIFQNVWSALLLGASAFLVLTYWRVDITPLLASAGILGIVIGLAARDTIANLFGSIALYADGTYSVGDFIVLESGERGRVEDISIRSTVIRTRDDMLVTVPNSVLNTATITNESEPQRERRVRIPVGVAYGSDLDHVEAVLLDVADDERLVLDDPSPRVRVRGFGDSAVDVELLCWVNEAVLRGRVSHRLFKSVYAAFTDEGIEIPFPQRVVTMTGEDAAVPGTNPDHTPPVGVDGDRPGN
mgnify:CR=1 FL=1